MSARNSSYWLRVVARSHSDLSLQASSTPSNTPRGERDNTLLSSCTFEDSNIKSIEEEREKSIDVGAIEEVIYEHLTKQINGHAVVSAKDFSAGVISGSRRNVQHIKKHFGIEL